MRLSAIHIYENFPKKVSQFIFGRLFKSVNFLLRHPVDDLQYKFGDSHLGCKHCYRKIIPGLKLPENSCICHHLQNCSV